MCFNDVSSSDGGFSSGTNTHSRMRHKKLTEVQTIYGPTAANSSWTLYAAGHRYFAL